MKTAKAAIPALAVTDTVKQVDGTGRVTATVDRATLRTVQTPQAFAATSLRAAYRGTEPIDAPDCASLVEARGGRIRVVEGDLRLLKVTTGADLALVESWL